MQAGGLCVCVCVVAEMQEGVEAGSQYLNVVVMVVALQLLPAVRWVAHVLPPRVERVHHDLLGALDFRPAEGATLSFRVHLPRR